MTGLRAAILVLGGATAVSACAPYDPAPVSVYQWERRQQEIERREAERVRVCATVDKESARYQRDCAGVKS